MAGQLLTIEEAAQYLNVSKTTLRRWTKSGRMPCSRVGAKGERRFLKTDLDASLKAASSTSDPSGSRSSSDPLVVLAHAAARGVPRHVCLHFRDREELWQLFRPYVTDHLRQRAPILYIHAEGVRSEVQAWFTPEGYESAELIRAGLLRLLEPPEAYLRADTFVPERMVDFMEAAILGYRAAGHEVVLIAGEMSWYLTGTPGVDRMIEYERLLNKLLVRYPSVTIVCHYDMHRLDGAVTLGALCSHPHVQFGGRLVPGYFAESDVV